MDSKKSKNQDYYLTETNTISYYFNFLRFIFCGTNHKKSYLETEYKEDNDQCSQYFIILLLFLMGIVLTVLSIFGIGWMMYLFGWTSYIAEYPDGSVSYIGSGFLFILKVIIPLLVLAGILQCFYCIFRNPFKRYNEYLEEIKKNRGDANV